MLVNSFTANNHNSSIMSQNHPNAPSSNSSGLSFGEPYGNRVYSLGEVETLRRMTVQNNQQQQQQGTQQQEPNSQLPTNPFVMLTQVPIQATPFANYGNAQGSNTNMVKQQQQSSSTPNSGMNSSMNSSINSEKLRGNKKNPKSSDMMSSPDEDSWAQLLQPTPLAPNHFHNSKPQQQQPQPQPMQNTSQFQHGMSLSQQSMQQQPQPQQHPMQQQQPSQQQQQQLPGNNNKGENPFNPSTLSFLQELMMNAATAALQQQQQQQMMQPPNSQQQQSFPQQQQQLQGGRQQQQQPSTADSTFSMPVAVDSSVSPVTRPESSDEGAGSDGVQAWKQMWDSASKAMFQQQHQLLQQRANTGQLMLNNNNNKPNNNPPMPAQPAKRKFDDFDQDLSASNNRSMNSNFRLDSFGSDAEGDDDFLDIAPTPLSEIRAREETMVQQHQQQHQQHNQQSSMMPSPQQQSVQQSMQQNMMGLAQQQGQWQNWGAQQPQPQPQPRRKQQGASSDVSKASKQKSMNAQKQAFILPSTMMPPTVLASTFTEQQVKNTSRKRRAGVKSARFDSPYHALEMLVQERGYGSNIRITSEEAGYDAVPSPLQLASFGTEVVKAVHTSDPKRLGELLSTGLSPNPCNQFRDSIVDLVCKRANEEIFQCLLEQGSELRVCDGFGRTPLHHCCWASEFSSEIAGAILQRDLLQLFIEDKRGQTPLEYVRPNLADAWIEFLEEHVNEFFPIGGSIPVVRNMKEQRPEGSIPDPPNSLPVSLAGAVSSGKVTLQELREMDADTRAQYE